MALSGGNSRYQHRDAGSYGQFRFTKDELWNAFLFLREMVKNPAPPGLAERVFVPLAVIGP